MSFKIYQISTAGSSSNASLTYNFDNVIKGPSDNTTTLSAVKTLFSEYDENINHVSFTITAPSNLGSMPHQLSYYDNVKNLSIDYTINMLHVCPSPVHTTKPTKYKSALSIILECTSNDSEKNILLIIIPLSFIDYIEDTNKKSKTFGQKILSTTPETNINNLTLIVNSFTQTDSNLKNSYRNLSFDINAFIPSAQFNVYIVGNNKFIYTNPIQYDYMEIGSMFNDIIIPDFTSTTVYSINYKSATAPSKQNFLVQNDIYIDCYKVGESSKIDGGIINTDKPPKKNNKDKKKNEAITAVTGLYGGGLFLFMIIVGIISKIDNDESKTYLQELIQYKNYLIGITALYVIILFSILFSM